MSCEYKQNYLKTTTCVDPCVKDKKEDFGLHIQKPKMCDANCLYSSQKNYGLNFVKIYNELYCNPAGIDKSVIGIL